MAGNILFLVRRLTLVLEHVGRTQTSAAFGLTTTQVMALRYLGRQGGGSVCATQLHHQLGISKAALSTALKGLCEAGYLQVSACPGDDRKKQISLTPKALDFLGQIQAQMEELEQQACRGLTREQLDIAEYCLNKILQNLSGPEPAGSSPDRRKIQC